MLLAGTGVSGKKLTVFYSTNKNESHGMNKKVSIATLSAFLVATSPAMAVNEANNCRSGHTKYQRANGL